MCSPVQVFSRQRLADFGVAQLCELLLRVAVHERLRHVDVAPRLRVVDVLLDVVDDAHETQASVVRI